MRPNTQCARCQADVRTATHADTDTPIILDVTPSPDRQGFHVTDYRIDGTLAQPLPPGATATTPLGIVYPEHTCAATITP